MSSKLARHRVRDGSGTPAEQRKGRLPATRPVATGRLPPRLEPSLPHLTHFSLHRRLQRHGIARLPEVDDAKPKQSRFKPYPIGFFHIDIAEVHTEEGRFYLVVASWVWRT